MNIVVNFDTLILLILLAAWFIFVIIYIIVCNIKDIFKKK